MSSLAISPEFLEGDVKRVGDSETGWRYSAVTVMTVPARRPRSTCALCAGRGAPKGSSVPRYPWHFLQQVRCSAHRQVCGMKVGNNECLQDQTDSNYSHRDIPQMDTIGSAQAASRTAESMQALCSKCLRMSLNCCLLDFRWLLLQCCWYL
jgi:hypothetical protein